MARVVGAMKAPTVSVVKGHAQESGSYAISWPEVARTLSPTPVRGLGKQVGFISSVKVRACALCCWSLTHGITGAYATSSGGEPGDD